MSTTDTQQPKVTVRDEGFTVLRDPVAAIADIVFIHGLQGHPKKTWQYYQKAKGFPFSKRPEISCYWPEELLPRSFPTCRILTYGYDSKVTNYFSRAANQSNVLDHARAFLDEFEEFRRESVGRPIVFVTHSLGGLLLKAVLRKASSTKTDAPDARVIRDTGASTAGTIFLGTPHRGSDYADLGRKVALAARALQFDRSTSILRDLKVDSSILEVLHESFLELIDSQKFGLFTFAESQGLGIPLIARDKVVPKWSAHLGLPDEVEQKGDINANHRNMCRFEDAGSQGYGKVRRAIDRCISRRQTDRLKDSDFLDALQQLNMNETRLRYEQVEQACKDTYEWIFTNKTLGLETWLRSTTEPLYWIKGKPASGKSTLMKLITGHKNTARSFLRPTRRICKASFFFHNRGSYIQKTLDGLLREILHAIDTQIPELRPVFFETYQVHKPQDSFTKFPWSWEIMSSLFSNILEQDIVEISILLFLDALDEYSGDYKKIVRFLQSSHGSNKTELKICFSSRPEQIFLDHFSDIPGFFLQDHTEKDIMTMIHTTFGNNPRMKSTLDSNNTDSLKIVHALQAELAQESNGVFLWLKLALEDILAEYTNGKSLWDLVELLRELPNELEDYYDHIMRRCANERYSQECDIMLEVMRCAYGRLSLYDLFAAIRLFHVEDLKAQTLKLPEIDDAKRQIRSRCGLLIDILKADGYTINRLSGSGFPHSLGNYEVQFLHQTVNFWVYKRSRVPGVLLKENGCTALLKVVVHDALKEGPRRDFDTIVRRIMHVEAITPGRSFEILSQVETIMVGHLWDNIYGPRPVLVRHLAIMAGAPVLVQRLWRHASTSLALASRDLCDLINDQIWNGEGYLRNFRASLIPHICTHLVEHSLQSGMDLTASFEVSGQLHREDGPKRTTFLHQLMEFDPMKRGHTGFQFPRAVKQLIHIGFDMNGLDGNANTVLDIALGHLKKRFGEIGYQRGWLEKLDKRDFANLKGYIETCKLLLNAGAKISRPGDGLVITVETKAALLEKKLSLDERFFDPPVLSDGASSPTLTYFGGLSISSIVPGFLRSR